MTRDNPGSSGLITREVTDLFRILLIEDTFDLREEIKEYFSESGKDIFSLNVSCDASDGLEKVRNDKFDLVLLDAKLNKETGPDICRRLRESCSGPLVFITRLENDDDLSLVYALGADDYLIKPFTPQDVFRKTMEYVEEDKKPAVSVLECGGIRMNPLTGLVTLDGKIIELTGKTTNILRILLENKPDTVSRDIILKEVWGEDYSGTVRVVDTRIKELRKALGRKQDLIRTVKGTGYRIKG